MTRPWSRAFARLALMAVLALSLLPSAGRLAGSAAPHAAMAMPHAVAAEPMAAHGHCADMPDTRATARQPAPVPRLPAGNDCDYCPLLAALSLPAAPSLAVAPLAWPQAWRPVAALGRAGGPAAPGLGARGPPARG